MADKIHPALQPAVTVAVAETKGPGVTNDQGHPEPAPNTSQLMGMLKQLTAVTTQVAQTQQASITGLTAQVQQQLASINSLTNLLNTVVGGPSVAASLQQLYTLIQQDIASDATTAADIMARLDLKANASTVQGLSQTLNTLTGTTLPALSNTVAQHTTDLATKASVQALTEGLAGKASTQALTTGLAGKLSKSGDTSTGQQIGPNGMTAEAYITNQQVAIGVKRPIPVGFNIGTGNTTLDPVLTDPLGMSRKAMVLKVYLWMTTTATLAATVKVGTTPGGVEILSKTYLLTALPGLNNLLELSPPALVVLNPGTTIYVTANSGKWVCAVDTLFVTGL